MKNQIFLDPETRSAWKVLFNERVCSPDFQDKGAANAYLSMLIKGTRKPEYSKVN